MLASVPAQKPGSMNSAQVTGERSLRLADDWSAKGLREPVARLLRPDAVLEIERDDGDGTHEFLIE